MKNYSTQITLIAAIIIFAISMAPRAGAYWQFLSDPSLCAGDARQQITPYLLPDAEHDYISRYYRHAFIPAGIDWLYAGISHIADIDFFARWMGLGLFLTAVGFTVMAVWNLGGAWPALACLAYLLSTNAIAEITLHGIPRAFAPFLMAASFYAASRKSWRGLAMMIILSAFFYPVIAALDGLWLVIILFFWRDKTWHWRIKFPQRRYWPYVILSGMAAIGILLLHAWDGHDYGEIIRLSMLADFPEAGPKGRYQSSVDGIWSQSLPATLQQTRLLQSIAGAGRPFIPLLSIRNWWHQGHCLSLLAIAVLVIALGLRALYRRGNATPAFLACSATMAIALGYVIAYALMPYGFLPDRYISYGLVILLPAFLIMGLEGIYQAVALHLPARRTWRVALHMILLFSLPILLGGDGVHARKGEAMLAGDVHRIGLPAELQQTIKNLPDSSLIAGWPNDSMDDIAFFLRKRVWLHYETHQAFHTGYALVMRERMQLLMDAMFASDTQPLHQLSAQGVTHVLLYLPTYQKNTPPRYFAPFSDYMQKNWPLWQQKPAAIWQLPADDILYDDGIWRLVKL